MKNPTLKTYLTLLLAVIAAILSCDTPKSEKQPAAEKSKEVKAQQVQQQPPQTEPANDTYRVYLANLNNYQYPSSIIINFGKEVAPYNQQNFKPEKELSVVPAVEGYWRWSDPSNLAFSPKVAFSPETKLQIDVTNLKIRDNSGITFISSADNRKLIEFTTPPLQASLSKCVYEDIKEKPFARRMNIELIANYPFSDKTLRFNSALSLGAKNTNPTPNLNFTISKSEYSQIATISSERILRPAEDGELKFNVKPQAFGSYTDQKLNLNCTLPLSQKEFDLAADNNKINSVITARFGEAQDKEKEILPVILSFYEKTNNGYSQLIKNTGTVDTLINEGITIDPPVAGTWKNGNTDQSAPNYGNVYFTPEKPLPPGVKFSIQVDPKLFPDLIFEDPKTQVTVNPLYISIATPVLYSDPNDSKVKKVTATVTVNYPPKKGEIEKLLEVYLSEPKGDLISNNEQPLGFEVNYDQKNPRIAYIVTSPVKIAERKTHVRFYLKQGLYSTYEGLPSASYQSSYLDIPSSSDYFNFNQISAANVIKDDGSVDRILAVNATTELENIDDLKSKITAYLLPDCNLPDETKRAKSCAPHNNPQFLSADEVFEDIIKDSTPVNLAYISSTQPQNTEHNFKFASPDNRKIFVKIPAGIKSKDGYVINKDTRSIAEITSETKALKIQHSGSLLSLSGDRKLGIVARGVTRMEAELARIMPENLNHLFAVTDGDITKPEFNYYRFSTDNISEKFRFDEEFPELEDGKPFYSTVDFGRFIKNGNLPKGLFILTIKEKAQAEAASDEDSEEYTEEGEEEGAGEEYEEEGSYEEEGERYCDICRTYHEPGEHTGVKDSRLVLLTDIGIIVKDSDTKEHDLFSMSFRTGEPIAGAKVTIIGKNGLPILERITDKTGKASFPQTADFKNEKEPIAYVVQKDGDLSFLPFGKAQRELNNSQFDIGGVYNYEEVDSLQSYIFSDRGIYRPGDTAHISTILRKRDWSQIPKGLPLEITATDPRGQTAGTYKLAFDKFGFEEINFATDSNAPTGIYTFTLNIIKNNERRPLGSGSIKVENFQPDRLNVKSSLGDGLKEGFSSPAGLTAKVEVLNLFGTPAAANNVKGTLWVMPWSGYLEQYRDYSFKRSNPETLPNTAQDLGETQTDEKGNAEFQLGLDKFTEPVYQISFAGEGFEKDSGRSVVNNVSKLVSDFEYLVGIKSGQLDYITKDTERSVKLISIDKDLKPAKLENLSASVSEKKYIATLIKQPNGLLAYESTLKKELLRTEPLSLAAGDNELKLDTSIPGDFEVEIKDNAGRLLNAFSYTIAGDGNISRNVEKNSLLDIKLNKKEFAPEEEIEAQIIAPFTGSGLITIETDHVITHKWFKAENNATVQRIKLPAKLSGNAYLSVAFARSLASKEIYMNPLSYGSVPFSISKAGFKNEVAITTPGEVSEDKILKISYKVNEPSRLAVFAVDEGILQFARYKTPDPLSGFFKKRALQVRTFQILDLLLPDYSIVKSLSSSGGDEDSGAGKFKNPFSRKNKPPVVYWGGIRNVKAGEGMLEMPLPDYFSGSVKAFAVAVNEKKIGVATSTTKVKRPFVILPQMPYAVSPGDEFEVGALIANNFAGSGPDAKLNIKLKLDGGFEIKEDSARELVIPENKELPVKFKLKADNKLKSFGVKLEVTGKDKANKSTTAEVSEEISVRPAQPFMTRITSGVIRPNAKEEFKDVALTRKLYPEKSEITANISPSPASLIKGMIEYLKSYPYGCNEQAISAAFPAIVLADYPDFGLDKKEAEKYVNKAFKKLKARQKYDGSFGSWDIVSPTDNFVSAYATHFLLEARNRGYSVDETLISRAKSYLDIITNEKKTSMYDLLAQSYAAYVLTSFGDVTTTKVKEIEQTLNSEWGSKWQETAVRLFLAGSYKLLRLDSDSKRLLGDLPKTWDCQGGSNCNLPFPLSHHGFFIGTYYSIVTNLFPEIFNASSAQTENMLKMGEELASRDNYTLTYSFGLLGMSGVLKNFSEMDPQRFPIMIDGTQAAAPAAASPKAAFRSYPVPLNSQSIRFKRDQSFPVFYSVKEAGFDNTAATEPLSGKLVVERKLTDEKGQELKQVNLQDKLYVTVTLKPQGELTNIAVVDIIPGGFEIDLTEEGLGKRQSLDLVPANPEDQVNNNHWSPDYIDVQEDRVLFFGNLDGSAKTFTYRLKPLNVGKFNVPPAFAEGMYDNEIFYRGVSSSVEVTRDN